MEFMNCYDSFARSNSWPWASQAADQWWSKEHGSASSAGWKEEQSEDSDWHKADWGKSEWDEPDSQAQALEAYDPFVRNSTEFMNC